MEEALIQQIIKDFLLVGLSMPPELISDRIDDRWKMVFSNHLSEINRAHNSKLIQLMYRIDVNEKKLIELGDMNELVEVILLREEEKIRIRKNNPKGS